jgi:hypothetical protein
MDHAFDSLDAALKTIGVEDRDAYLQYYLSEPRQAMLKAFWKLQEALLRFKTAEEVPFPCALEIAELKEEFDNCMRCVNDEHDLNMPGSVSQGLEGLEPVMKQRDKAFTTAIVNKAKALLQSEWGIEKIHDYWCYKNSFSRRRWLEHKMSGMITDELINSTAFPMQGTREAKLVVLKKMEGLKEMEG